MKRCLLSCWLLLLAADAPAHRLDEYLQAARIAVAADRIDLSIDLTPGVAVAGQLLPLLDPNQDGRFSEPERDAYARKVLKDLRIGLNENALALRLVDRSYPTADQIRAGIGIIRIRATASFKALGAGGHVLSLTNGHLPAISVYLVNALVPKDPAIQITKQTRDDLQKGYRLEFGVAPSPIGRVPRSPSRWPRIGARESMPPCLERTGRPGLIACVSAT